MKKLTFVCITIAALIFIQGCTFAPTSKLSNQVLWVNNDGKSTDFSAPLNMSWVSGLSNNLIRKVYKRNSKWQAGAFVKDAVYFDRYADDVQHGLYDKGSKLDSYIDDEGLFVLYALGDKNDKSWNRTLARVSKSAEYDDTGKNYKMYTRLIEGRKKNDNEVFRVLTTAFFSKNNDRYMLQGVVVYESPEDKLFIEDTILNALETWGIN